MGREQDLLQDGWSGSQDYLGGNEYGRMEKEQRSVEGHDKSFNESPNVLNGKISHWIIYKLNFEIIDWNGLES